MIFRGEFTDKEKSQLSSQLPKDWIVTKNQLGFWVRSPEFKWDEVIQADKINVLSKRVEEYIRGL